MLLESKSEFFFEKKNPTSFFGKTENKNPITEKNKQKTQMTTLVEPLRDSEDAEHVRRHKGDERKLKKKDKKKSKDGGGEKMTKEKKKKRKRFDADGGGGDIAAPAARGVGAAPALSQPPKKKKKVRSYT